MWWPINPNEIPPTQKERMFYTPGCWEFRIWHSLNTSKQLFEGIQCCFEAIVTVFCSEQLCELQAGLFGVPELHFTCSALQTSFLQRK